MNNEYDELLEKVDWYFETEDTLKHVRLLLCQGRTTLGTYKELSMWAGAAESDLRALCNERTWDAVQIPLPF